MRNMRVIRAADNSLLLAIGHTAVIEWLDRRKTPICRNAPGDGEIKLASPASAVAFVAGARYNTQLAICIMKGCWIPAEMSVVLSECLSALQCGEKKLKIAIASIQPPAYGFLL